MATTSPAAAAAASTQLSPQMPVTTATTSPAAAAAPSTQLSPQTPVAAPTTPTLSELASSADAGGSVDTAEFVSPTLTIPARRGTSAVFGGGTKPERRLTGKEFKESLPPEHEDRARKVYDAAHRSGLGDRHERETLEEAKKRGGQRTEEEDKMLNDPTLSRSKAGASLNHDVAAESAVQALSVMAAHATSPSASAAQRKQARSDMQETADALTADSPRAHAETQKLIAPLTPGADMDPAAAADAVTAITAKAADHRHNLGVGASRKNSSLSNRRDPATSPGGTHVTAEVQERTDRLKPVFEKYEGEDVARQQLAVHRDPATKRIFSSKQRSVPRSGADTASSAAPAGGGAQSPPSPRAKDTSSSGK